MNEYTLGIDTSNYTTSMAILDDQGRLVLDQRKLLTVKDGERGLRQSDALFQHVMNMPHLFKDISMKVDCSRIKKVCVSSRPRPVEGSYMPVFNSGQSFGQTIAELLSCGYKEYSHQEGHIQAALWSIKKKLRLPFLAVHISGGTTEILRIDKGIQHIYKIDIVGGTKDISAGQLIDRVGVKLGLKFPAGRELDHLACGNDDRPISLPVSVKEFHMNFSGVETKVMRMIDDHRVEVSSIAQGILQCIATSLKRTVVHYCQISDIKDILFIGGVASSTYIKTRLVPELASYGLLPHFGEPSYCTDNAVGTALLGIEFS